MLGIFSNERLRAILNRAVEYLYLTTIAYLVAVLAMTTFGSVTSVIIDYLWCHLLVLGILAVAITRLERALTAFEVESNKLAAQDIAEVSSRRETSPHRN